MKSIHELSWNETSFLAKLQLFFKSIRNERPKIYFNDPLIQGKGYSALSSTYYSIVGTAMAHLRARLHFSWHLALLPFWFVTWLPLCLWCFARMGTLSDNAAKALGDNMNGDQCDIRQSILRRHRRFKEAGRCINHCLRHGPRPMKPHTRGLLHIGLASIYARDRNVNRVHWSVLYAVAMGEDAVDDGELRQAARIFRSAALLADQFSLENADWRISLHRQAQDLIEKVGAKDQQLKRT